MKKIDLIFIISSLVVAFTSYITTTSMYIPTGIFAIYILYYFVLIRKRIKRYLNKVEIVHACYHFINSFIITMSVKESLDEAYQNGIRVAPKSLLIETNAIENMTIIERINFLRSYFNLAIYKMFINIIALHQEQGGNILIISDSLIRECTRVEKTLSESTSIGNRHLVEFFVLWLLSFFILIFLRFAIAQFYNQMINSNLMIGLICGFYLIFLISVHLFLLKFTSLSIKEDIENV